VRKTETWLHILQCRLQKSERTPKTAHSVAESS